MPYVKFTYGTLHAYYETHIFRFPLSILVECHVDVKADAKVFRDGRAFVSNGKANKNTDFALVARQP